MLGETRHTSLRLLVLLVQTGSHCPAICLFRSLFKHNNYIAKLFFLVILMDTSLIEDEVLCSVSCDTCSTLHKGPEWNLLHFKAIHKGLPLRIVWWAGWNLIGVMYIEAKLDARHEHVHVYLLDGVMISIDKINSMLGGDPLASFKQQIQIRPILPWYIQTSC